MTPEQFAPTFYLAKNHNKRFGEFEFDYFGRSNVGNKLFTYVSLKYILLIQYLY